MVTAYGIYRSCEDIKMGYFWGHETFYDGVSRIPDDAPTEHIGLT